MGPTAAIFLKQEASAETAICIEGEPRASAVEVQSTRKGRNWTVSIVAKSGQGARPIDVHLSSTQDRLAEYEDILARMEIDSAIYLSHIGIAAGCNQAEDWQIMDELLGTLAAKLDGIATRPEK